jgi:hypothetical protein
VIDARNVLDDTAAESGEGASNEMFKVTVTPQTQTIYDESILLAKLGMTRDEAIAQKIIVINQRPARISVSELKQLD